MRRINQPTAHTAFLRYDLIVMSDFRIVHRKSPSQGPSTSPDHATPGDHRSRYCTPYISTCTGTAQYIMCMRKPNKRIENVSAMQSDWPMTAAATLTHHHTPPNSSRKNESEPKPIVQPADSRDSHGCPSLPASQTLSLAAHHCHHDPVIPVPVC